jgi:hypothetical protein
MAQQGSKKSRVIVWTIVGILVVIAAIMMLTRGKGDATSGKRTIRVDQIEQLANNLEKKVDNARHVIDRKQGRGEVTPEAYAAAQGLLDKAKADIAEFRGMTDPQELFKKLEQAKQDLSDARKAAATTEADEGGGQ